uniref:Uncharacterized protein n=2 Tax=Cercopithecinae TaxID=9528 RepID=A0A2K5LBE1_CERAT
MVKFQVLKTNFSLPIPGNKHVPECSLNLERTFSLLNANLMMDVKIYDQILENTFLYCTVGKWLM